jgi:hypothetical protein
LYPLPSATACLKKPANLPPDMPEMLLNCCTDRPNVKQVLLQATNCLFCMPVRVELYKNHKFACINLLKTFIPVYNRTAEPG